jgi:ribose 5-phosphate isomerase RpiB
MKLEDCGAVVAGGASGLGETMRAGRFAGAFAAKSADPANGSRMQGSSDAGPAILRLNAGARLFKLLKRIFKWK